MNPAASVIVFTVCAGAGYGLLIVTALAASLGLFAGRGDLVAWASGLAIAAIVTGLISSTLHLGRPLRAWRALGQWRSSWLAREGVAALAGLPPAALFLGLSALGVWPWLAAAAGLVAAALALVTIVCTAMISASLVPIARWRSRWTPPVYVALALQSGTLLLASFAGGRAAGSAIFDWLAVAAIAAGWALKTVYWRDRPDERLARTTGLESLERTRALALEDGAPTFVHREMLRTFPSERARVARLFVQIALFALPLALMAFALAGPASAAAPATWAATVSAAFGLGAERWLFFAEARHAVGVFHA